MPTSPLRPRHAATTWRTCRAAATGPPRARSATLDFGTDVGRAHAANTNAHVPDAGVRAPGRREAWRIRLPGKPVWKRRTAVRTGRACLGGHGGCPAALRPTGSDHGDRPEGPARGREPPAHEARRAHADRSHAWHSVLLPESFAAPVPCEDTGGLLLRCSTDGGSPEARRAAVLSPERFTSSAPHAVCRRLGSLLLSSSETKREWGCIRLARETQASSQHT